jgi:hypothetical protein
MFAQDDFVQYAIQTLCHPHKVGVLIREALAYPIEEDALGTSSWYATFVRSKLFRNNERITSGASPRIIFIPIHVDHHLFRDHQ